MIWDLHLVASANEPEADVPMTSAIAENGYRILLESRRVEPVVSETARGRREHRKQEAEQ